MTVIRTAASLWALTAVLLLAARLLFPPLLLLALPFCWPSIFVLGSDEVQETYGYWGELFWNWVLSIPCCFLYAYGIAVWKQESSAAQRRPQATTVDSASTANHSSDPR